jgi:hypothetical protein
MCCSADLIVACREAFGAVKRDLEPQFFETTIGQALLRRTID